jgi:O-acetyl-ADP-ribose deacetylase (regulator of RNase III)
MKSIAFPAISCGIYGYPWKDAAEIATATVATFLEQEAESIEAVNFVFLPNFDGPALQAVFEEALSLV